MGRWHLGWLGEPTTRAGNCGTAPYQWRTFGAHLGKSTPNDTNLPASKLLDIPLF